MLLMPLDATQLSKSQQSCALPGLQKYQTGVTCQKVTILHTEFRHKAGEPNVDA